MAKSNYGKMAKGGNRKQKRAIVSTAGVGQLESKMLRPINTYQEEDVSSKKRQKSFVKQLQDKVWHISNTLETYQKQIAALKDASADLLERVQHFEAKNM